MSLDVYLDVDTPVSQTPSDRIFIRENGSMVELSREEWDQRFPGREPVTVRDEDETTTRVYQANITHNLNRMADAAGIYKPLWRPDELEITRAEELIEPLSSGLEALKSNPERFEELNPENGWGTYEGLVQFVENYLGACRQYPQATVSVWR